MAAGVNAPGSPKGPTPFKDPFQDQGNPDLLSKGNPPTTYTGNDLIAFDSFLDSVRKLVRTFQPAKWIRNFPANILVNDVELPEVISFFRFDQVSTVTVSLVVSMNWHYTCLGGKLCSATKKSTP